MTQASAPTPERASLPFADQQVVVLHVKDGDYAVPIGRVQEIVRVPAITRVPHAAAGVEGVINLRGRVLPVLDLGAALGLGSVERGKAARVVVVEQAASSVGLLVDGVSEVLPITGAQVDPPSEAAQHVEGPIHGVARVDQRLILLLDLDAALD